MKQINFFGYYGYKNTGDDSFIEALSWASSNLLNSEISHFNVKNVPIIQTSSVKFNEIPDIFGASTFYKLISLIQSSTIIFGGGSTFHEDIYFTNEKNLSFIKKKIVKSQKLGAVGISLGPFNNKEVEAKYIKILKAFDFLTLRDIDSYNLALSYDLPYKPIQSFDLASLLPKIYNNRANTKYSEIPVLGLILCNYESNIFNGNIAVENYRNNFIKKLIVDISKKFGDRLQINFYVFNGHPDVGDNNLTNYYISVLYSEGFKNVKKLNYNPNVKESWDSISDCNVIISTRLHGSIFSYFNNIPFFLVEYHNKCIAFLNTIEYPLRQRLHINLDSVKLQSNLITEILLNKNAYEPPKCPQYFTELTLDSFKNINA